MLRMLTVVSLMIGSMAPAAAGMPARVACVADDVYFVWYGTGLDTGLAAIGSSDPNQKLAGVRATQPETRMRFEGMKLYISDATRPEYFYAPVARVIADEYRSSEFTLLFDSQYRTLIAINVSSVDTTITSLKCVGG